MIISIDAEKDWKKFSEPYKSSEEARIRKNSLQQVKTLYNKPITNITLNGENFKSFPLSQVWDKGVYFHHCYSWNPSQKIMVRERNNRDSNIEEISQTIHICRWNDPMSKRPERLQQKHSNIW
jgi:hypothetical protein